MILALDPGKKTGWAMSNGRCGTLDLSEHDDLADAYNAFEYRLSGVFSQYQIERIVIERAFGRAAFTADLPMVLTGIAHMVAKRAGVPRSELTASQVKKRVTGNGRATKAAVIAGVALEGWTPDTDHAADACAVLIAWQREQEKTA